jgi:hypothetical protein
MSIDNAESLDQAAFATAAGTGIGVTEGSGLRKSRAETPAAFLEMGMK